MPRRKHIQITKDRVTLYDDSGRAAANMSKQETHLPSPTLRLGTTDVGRITTDGGQQQNPMGDKVPSTIVSPQKTWNPALPEVNIAYTMILSIMALVFKVEDSFESSTGIGRARFGRPVRRTSYQIVDFEAFLPEDLTEDF